MTNVILFGAGGGGKNTLSAFKRSVRVLAVVDNDPRKHGTLFCGLPVIRPEEILELDFDLVVVASMYAPEIYAQLLKLGVPKEKVEIVDDRKLTNSASFPWDALIFLGVGLVVAVGGAAFLIRWLF